MFFDYNNRPLIFAKYIIATKGTLRQTAKVYNISKSTVHNDVTKRLKKISSDLFFQVKKILDNNFAEKHIRGGQSTKTKYENLKKD